MSLTLATWLLASLVVLATGELLQNGGFESGAQHWDCWNIHCAQTNDRHSGQHAISVSGRSHYYEGPSQNIHVTSGHSYSLSAWVKLLSDHGGQSITAMVDFHFTDDSHDYQGIASHSNAKTSDGWVHLQGTFTAPSKSLREVRVYFQSGPEASVNFAVDEVSVNNQGGGGSSTGGHSTSSVDQKIDQLRKSNINVHVTTASGISTGDVSIRLLQTKKSFPFGTAANAGRFNANAGNGKYRDFIYRHFNWAVPENCLKWPSIEPQRGHKNYDPCLNMIRTLKNHGIKVRGHNLVWSVDRWVQDWVKQLSGNELRNVVKAHIEETMSKTHGLLEHWDVNNENLHGQWYQNRLHDQDYNLELFREAHHADSHPKLFLNDYSVVASGASTNAYLQQARHFKAANVGLYGIGAQCHFGDGQEPDTNTVWGRLDTLAQAGLPIWATELDVQSSDENRRADFYEKALKALYSHSAVEGILFWGFWDQAHWRGEAAALVKGNNLELTAAGRRVLDLLENEWMTDETHDVSQAGNQFTVRGFHGDYEVHVTYQGREMGNLKQTFTLGHGAHTVNLNVHT